MKTFLIASTLIFGLIIDLQALGDCLRSENDTIKSPILDGEDGPFKIYKNGFLLVEGSKKNKMYDGKITFYFRNSIQRKKEENYKNGFFHGKNLFWYKNGNLSSSMNYENGVEEGPFILYWPNGKIAHTGIYINGRLGNEVVDYDSSGSVIIK